MKPFLMVTPEAIVAFEKLIRSGARGTHLLFSIDTIRGAFSRDLPAAEPHSNNLATRVQKALSDLVGYKSLEERQDYIESVEQEIRDLLVHLYFGFLDRFMGESKKPELLN
jgi:hypothetical protein